MGTPRMDQEGTQSTPLAGLQPNSQDRSNSRRMRSNSIRDQTGSDKEGQRSRASSTAKSDLSAETHRYNKTRGHVNDAVHSSLDPIDPNHTAIPPDVLNKITSQITQSVLQQLKASQFSPPTSYANEQVDSMSSIGGSPPIDRDKVYTPPSPYRASEEAAQTGSPTSPRKKSSFPPPPPEVRRPPSPPFSHGTLSEDSDPKEGANVRLRSARLSNSGMNNSENIRSKTERVERSSIGSSDATILEKIWGELFDGKGASTVRLSQFLRGIAVHLIEDYEPKHSLVISPDKMQRYYEETKLTNELYPWRTIFDDRTSSISRMFREIEAQHHLVQDRLDERPDIPGLTPIGFETWMTLVLKAHPNEEFERLAYTALHMPVNNPDDRKERFPKELSRRQFPKDPDQSQIMKLQKVMFTHCAVKMPARNGSVADQGKAASSAARTQDTAPTPNAAQPKPIVTDYPLSQTSTRSSIPELDRNPLRATVSEAAAEGSPIEVVASLPIERERKPYVAGPAGGKHYNDLDVPVIQPAETKPTYTGPPPPSKLARSSSLNSGRSADSKSRPTQPIAIHQKPNQPPLQMPPPVDLTPSQRPRTGSVYHRDAPRRGERNRSPSISRTNDFPHKSDGEVQYGSSYIVPGTPDYPSNSSWRPDNRFSDHRGSFSAESRDRDRDQRPRYHSVSGGDSHRHYASDEDYYRSSNASYPGPDMQYGSSQQYPPTSYRNRA